MATITDPIILDSTAQLMVSKLNEISQNVKGGMIETTTNDPGEGVAMASDLLIVYEE